MIKFTSKYERSPMRKVFYTCEEMDKRCYDEYSLSQEVLMEHAAMGMADYIATHHVDAKSILIVAGSGDNGADGMALARLLQFHIESIKVYIPHEPKSVMSKLQKKRIDNIKYIETVETLCDADIVIDALFGTGLNRPLNKKAENLINEMNDLNGIKIACDIPSGIDIKGKVENSAFCADTTITMGALKELLFYDHTKDLAGTIIRADLGIRYNHYTKGFPVSSYLLEPEDMDLPSRDFALDTHKGSFGHVSILCGEHKGAGIISGLAASRFGAGLVTLVSQSPLYAPPHLMHSNVMPVKTSAIAVGMGLGGDFDDDFLKKNILEGHTPVVLDADSFYLPKILEILQQKDREIVLTPHPKEFVSLWKIIFSEDITIETVQKNRFELVRRFAKEYPHITLLLKGANSIISQNGKVYINSLGDSRLSKGGSGDVLSGLIAALLAQGYIGIDAAIQASLALVMASSRYSGSSYAMLSTDIIEEISKLEEINNA